MLRWMKHAHTKTLHMSPNLIYFLEVSRVRWSWMSKMHLTCRSPLPNNFAFNDRRGPLLYNPTHGRDRTHSHALVTLHAMRRESPHTRGKASRTLGWDSHLDFGDKEIRIQNSRVGLLVYGNCPCWCVCVHNDMDYHGGHSVGARNKTV